MISLFVEFPLAIIIAIVMIIIIINIINVLFGKVKELRIEEMEEKIAKKKTIENEKSHRVICEYCGRSNDINNNNCIGCGSPLKHKK